MKIVNHHMMDVAVRVGKAGITDNVVKQVMDQLKKKNVIKVKFLPSAVVGNKKALVAQLAERSRSRVLHTVGFIAVLERKTKAQLQSEGISMEKVK